MGANDIQHGGDHYKGAKFQHWDLISKNGIGYLEGCSSKYASRWRKKNGAEDIRKGIHYCDKILEMVEDFHYRPSGHAPQSDLRRFFTDNHIEDHDEIAAIEFLCTWACADEIHAAKFALERLLVKAESFGVEPSGA